MNTELVIALISAGVPLIGATSGVVLTAIKLKQAKKNEQEASERAFYLDTASNIVLSAERLSLTGQEKKEYVMTRLENETIKAGFKFNYKLASHSVEQAVAVMNDHRNVASGKPLSEVLIKKPVVSSEEVLDELVKAVDNLGKTATNEAINVVGSLGTDIDVDGEVLKVVED